MTIYYPPTQNAIQKTLDAQLLKGITASMTLNNVIGIANKPGVCVVDFVDTNNKETPTKREYIAFTGVSGNTLTGLTRNADGGGTDQDHSVGAIVQFPPDILQQKAIIDTFTVEHGQDGTHDTSKVAGVDGWVNSDETWTYASATTITVPSGAASKYAKGDKIKLTQSGTVKYFYIISVADTVLTITGGSDYTLVSATISANYYSHASSPIGFPNYFNWTPVISGTGTIPTFSNRSGVFSINGTKVSVFFNLNNTSGGTAGSGTTDLTLNSPISSSINNSSIAGYFQSQPNSIMGGVWTSESSICLRKNLYANLVNDDFNDANNRYLQGFVEYFL